LHKQKVDMDLLKCSPEEKAIYDVMVRVEELGADPLLTDTVCLLSEAQRKLEAYFEKKADVDVKVFLTQREINGHFYAEQICASNWDEAQSFADKAGVKLIGEAVSEISALGEKDIKPQIGVDEWSDTIGETHE